MIGIPEAFSPTYAVARRKFLEAAAAGGLEVESHTHPLAGRDGDKVQSRVIRNRLMKEGEGNVAIRMDPAENIKPDKKSSSGRIDPMVATIMAVGRALAHKDDRSVYESRGLR